LKSWQRPQDGLQLIIYKKDDESKTLISLVLGSLVSVVSRLSLCLPAIRLWISLALYLCVFSYALSQLAHKRYATLSTGACSHIYGPGRPNSMTTGTRIPVDGIRTFGQRTAGQRTVNQGRLVKGRLVNGRLVKRTVRQRTVGQANQRRN